MARVKKKDHENLTSQNIRHVINLLQPKDTSKPITKKEACEILNISYNTTRLQRIIDEFVDQEAFVASRKAENKGKRASKEELAQIITEYLKSEPISNIAKSLYRSAGFVKAAIERIGVPVRPSSSEARSHISLLPESCIGETFREGETVWSAKYHAPAIIKKAVSENRYDCTVYQIYVIEPTDSAGTYFEYVTGGGFFAYAPAYDLGKLEHLKEYGVDISKI